MACPLALVCRLPRPAYLALLAGLGWGYPGMWMRLVVDITVWVSAWL